VIGPLAECAAWAVFHGKPWACGFFANGKNLQETRHTQVSLKARFRFESLDLFWNGMAASLNHLDSNEAIETVLTGQINQPRGTPANNLK